MTSEKEATASQQPRSSAMRRTTVASERSGPSCSRRTRRSSCHSGQSHQRVVRRILDAPAAAVALRRGLPPYSTQVIPEASYTGDHLRQAEGEPAVPAPHPFGEYGQERPDDATLPIFGEGEPFYPFDSHASPGLVPRVESQRHLGVPRSAENVGGEVYLRLHLSEQVEWRGPTQRRQFGA